MKLIKQPNGISCGPTCIKMVGEHYFGGLPDINEIEKMCETDNITGTPPERMIKGLDKLNVPYKIHYKTEKPFENLRAILDKGNVCIIRTLTYGIPHWIVAYDYTDKGYKINDPSFGVLLLNEETLNERWEPREYYCFEVMKK